MSQVTTSNACVCTPGCCCDARLARLEKRVRWIRTGLLIALGVLILFIGIAIGHGGPRPGMRGPRAAMMMRGERMQPPMVMPNAGPGPMGRDMRGGPDRGPDGPREGGPRKGPRGKDGPGGPDHD